jgi:transcription elongation GreA/GreB family factor
VNKRTLVKQIIEHLRGEVALYTRAALTARAEATDEQSKAEHKYDTRGLEASYLARGQSRQLAETEAAIEHFAAFHPKTFTGGEPIDLGALVELQSGRDRSLYFLCARSGGTEIVHEDREILVITPQSPLGQQLIGRRQGDALKLLIGGTRSNYSVLAVS